MGKGGRYAGTRWDLEGRGGGGGDSFQLHKSMGWENCVWSEWHTHLPHWLISLVLIVTLLMSLVETLGLELEAPGQTQGHLLGT